MFKQTIFFRVLLTAIVLVTISCKDTAKKSDNQDETILAGTTTILVDETIKSIVEDEVAVFESQYSAKIKLICKPESEIINLLIKNQGQIAILTRELTPDEAHVFIAKKINPKITKFGVDAIALITNSESKDTLIELQQVVNLMQEKSSSINGLVFENSNSSTLRYLNEIAGVKKGDKKNVYSLKSHTEVLDYIAENKNTIGVVGLNTIDDPSVLAKYTNKIKVVAVKGLQKNNANFYKPSQSNLAENVYPLQRDLYILNYQGTDGLGMGFASFVAGEIGQRIILKTGLLPVRIPSRNISIRNKIDNTIK